MRLRLVLALPILLALVPVAHATPPMGTGNISLTVGAIQGLVQQDGKGVIPYGGNVTVPVTVTFDCSLLAYEYANKQGSDINHFHVQPSDDKLPSWLAADELITYFPPPVAGAPAQAQFPVQQCAGGADTYTQMVTYPFAVTGAAPAMTPLALNLTANLGDDAFATPVPVPFMVQFHANYTVTPSIRFPAAVTGKSLNFTVAVRNNGNAQAMVLFNGVQASAGTLTGLSSATLAAGQTMVLPVSFTGPASCWTTATVAATSAIESMSGGTPMMMGGSSMTMGATMGSPTMPHPLAWTFTHPPCPAGGTSGSTSKKAGTPDLLPLATLALAALALRRRTQNPCLP